MSTRIKNFFLDFCILALFLILCSEVWVCSLAQEDNKSGKPARPADTQPNAVNVRGDTVEYTENREITASGNVEIDYKDTKLTSEKLIVNPQTKNVKTEGQTKIQNEKGVVEGSQIIYNFDSKTGTITDAKFRANPFFGKSRKMDKVSDMEFIGYNGYVTTCSMDHPHFRLRSKKFNIFPGDKIQTKDDIVYLSNVPVAYTPLYNHSLTDPFMHVELTPGKSKKWGPFMLSAWRFDTIDRIKTDILLDYRSLLGVAEGFTSKYTTNGFGTGNFKWYYTQERNKTTDFPKEDVNTPKVFQRYLMRWRHKWDIDNVTNMTTEFYRITDSKMILYPDKKYNFLKEYFPREYEKDSQPLSYVTLHHNFKNSSADVMFQKRTNTWYSQSEKLPEAKYSLPSTQIGQTPLYFEDSSTTGNYNSKSAAPSYSANDLSVFVFDTTNKVSLPTKIAFVNFTPFVGSEETIFDRDAFGAAMLAHPRTVFLTGSDLSTKFYRIFNLKTNFLNLDINNLRHIITPTVGYAYTHTPTVSNDKIRGGSSVNMSNSVALGLNNKLQTKRGDKKTSVDLANFDITTNYIIKPKTGIKRGSNLSDFLYKLQLLPYSWLRINADATYARSNHADPNYNHFSAVNYDVNFDFATERTIGIGQRYNRKGGDDVTFNFNWRLSPKWRFASYQRRNIGHDPTLKRGLREQEYTISRDLHCWTMEFTWNIKRGQGESVWLIFRLKAFPELHFDYNQEYHAPKPGSQSNV